MNPIATRTMIMKRILLPTALTLAFMLPAAVMAGSAPRDFSGETPAQRDRRMEWWREARFGMFIHWGLYSIPAGEWRGKDTHAEWIRTTAQIPLEVYDQFIPQFNPTNFNAAR